MRWQREEGSREKQKANVYMRFGKMKDAMNNAFALGLGYDLMMPASKRWHVEKNYADNFALKG